MAFTGPKWPLTLPISSIKICTRIGVGQDTIGCALHHATVCWPPHQHPQSEQALEVPH